MKTLRISLAMGGGVAMGTFSGAALTESLKLLLLFGKDRDGNEYKTLELDSMSGASAGAISLAILLRTLVDYKSVMKDANYYTEKEILEDLEDNYSKNVIREITPSKLEDLKALHVAQKIQERIWVNILDLNLLFGEKNKGKYDIEKAFGLLDRENVSKLVDKYICQNLTNISEKTVRVLSKDRFLFACSLSNLTPVKKPEVFRRYNTISSNGQSFKYISNLLNSVSSFEHAELRVIDFVFNKGIIENVPSDSRWIKFYPNELFKQTIKEATSFNLNESDSWRVLAASAIACGAFPIAFEPLLLKRYREEFGDAWPEQFVSIHKELTAGSVLANSFIDKDQPLDYSSFNFPYIDGGTFNNEPIKEAFKLSYYNDFNKEDTEVDRVVMFVDPIVRESDPLFKQSSYDTISNKIDDDSVNFEKISELNKAVGITSSIISMLKRQGSIKEEHKSDRFVENSNLNNQLQKYLFATETTYSDRPELIETAVKKIGIFLGKDVIPAGTRKVHRYLLWLAKRKVRNEEGKMISLFPILLNLPDVSFKMLLELLPDKNYNLPEAINHLIDNQSIRWERSDSDLVNEFQKLFLIALADIGLETIGKDLKAIRVGITPHNVYGSTISLPGSEMFAFGGFADSDVRQYSFNYGRVCALNILSSNEFRKYHDKSREIQSKNPSPFIDNSHLQQLESYLISQVQNIQLYSGGMTSYSKSLYKDGYNAISKRLEAMFKLAFYKQIGAGVALLFTGLTSIFTDKLFLWTVKSLIGRRINIKERKVVNFLKPLNVRIEIPKSSLVSLHYTLDLDSNKKKRINYNSRDYKGKKIIEFQLFLSTNLNFNRKTIHLFPFPYFELEENDPNLDPRKINKPHIDKLIVTNFWNNLGKGLEFTFPLHSKINNNRNSVFYSLMNLDYHINPRLRIQYDHNGEHKFYFEEGTIAFDKLGKTIQ